MGKKTVKGFGGNNGSREIPRSMAMARKTGKPVEVYRGPVSMDIKFDTVTFDYHDGPGRIAHRPYLNMRGHGVAMSAVEGQDLPCGAGRVLFSEVNAPYLDIIWELNNEEIAELASKGLFGADYDVVPKGARPVAKDPESPYNEPMVPKDDMPVPELLTQVVFQGCPVNMEIEGMSVDINGQKVPVIVATPLSQTGDKSGLIMTSELTGYNNIAQYFEPMRYYEHGAPGATREYISMDENSYLRDESEIQRAMQEAVEGSKIVPKKTLTLEEQAENRVLSGLAGDINERVAAAETDRDIDIAKQLEQAAETMADERIQQGGELEHAEAPSGEVDYLQDEDENIGDGTGREDPLSDYDDEKRRREQAADAGAAAAQEQADRDAIVNEAKSRGMNLSQGEAEIIRQAGED